MKLPRILRHNGGLPNGSPRGRKRGIALITVMSILAVLTVLIVAILTLAGNEYTASRAYAETVRARRLSDTVVSLVIGQIRQGTRPDASKGLFGNVNPTLWASQPGVIRTYTGTTGFDKAYKLYSSSRMVTKDKKELIEDINALRGWQTNPARFVDLNAPVVKYDINGTELARYFPIMDPRAFTLDKVEGFRFDETAMPGTDEEKYLPMPVEWLYFLEDGTIGTLTEDGKFQGARPATKENPIVARAAFWTDDESSKINVNTATEATPWYVPRADTKEDRDYATMQPVTNEVQRYPGHPATTCLSSVFFPGRYPDASTGDDESLMEERHYQAIYELGPKTVFGGSEGGKKKGREELVFDKDRLYPSVDELLFNIKREENQLLQVLKEEAQGGANPLERLERSRHFLTVWSRAPEVNAHGRPRISLWPVHETTGQNTRTTFDETLVFCTTLRGARDAYFFKRREHHSRHAEFYVLNSRNNVNLYQYLMAQVYQPLPGYGKSLAEKYGAEKKAPFKTDYYRDDLEYKRDHFQIALGMMDYIRGINIHDGNVQEPYARLNTSASFGQIAGINLIGRNLASDNGSSQQDASWHRPTLEPKGPGRLYTISEVSLVLHCSAEVSFDGTDQAGRPRFTNRGSGNGSDHEVIKRVVQGQHPDYPRWRARDLDKIDWQKNEQGTRWKFIEVGMITEMFAVAQGYHQIHPTQTFRLLTGGAGYRGGLHDQNQGSLRVNGVPLVHWGQSDGTPEGPIVTTAESYNAVRGNLPAGWYGWGGSGGYRLMRFGDFTLPATQGGVPVRDQFLANGRGPLRAWYCQTGVIVRADENLELTQDPEHPVQIVVYDQLEAGASIGNLVQVFNLNFAPEGVATFEAPTLNTPDYAGWTRRFSRAAAGNARDRPVDVLEPGANRECVKSLIVVHGDYRHVANKRNVPQELMKPHPSYLDERRAHSLTWSGPQGGNLAAGVILADDVYGRNLVAGANYDKGIRPDFTFQAPGTNPALAREFSPLMSPGYRFSIDPSITRDFDNGTGGAPDGAYINKADDGADDVPGSSIFNQKSPYFDVAEVQDFRYEDRFTFNFAPNRMVAGPVCFGSLPSAVQANAPWTCLLFRPNVSDESPHLGEPGNGLDYTGDITSRDGMATPQFSSKEGDPQIPGDHLWLDYFWMPVVQPYPISEPFSTAGKVNLNYQMIPFTHITRATALHAVFKGERLLAIPTNAGGSYKTRTNPAGWRKKIDADETLEQWEEKFREGDIFTSGSQICEMFLYPKGEGVTYDAQGRSIRNFWEEHGLTGDNTLEAPYNGIYPRVTTKSNVFKIYMTVQAVQKARSTPPDTFVAGPGNDTVNAEYRGSAVIERYIDPASEDIPNYKADLAMRETSIDFFYRWRVVNVQQFSP